MEIYCTRPGCPKPQNYFADLDDEDTLIAAQQKYCMACGMELLLRGRYIPSKLLGQGGFGTAFLARDRDTPGMRKCVVKQFQPSGDLSPQQLQMAQDLFKREAQVLEQLGSNHPQIPNLFAFFYLNVQTLQPGKQDKFFYLVQEFIDGQDLEEELKTKGTFSEDGVLEVLQKILPVLEFVHENGSIHRDIKPSNIMRHRNGRLYLLDFGAVKQVTQGAPEAGRSTGIYTPGFAPPEQMRGGQVYPSTDLYALAVTVLVLLTGKEPGDLYDNYIDRWNWRPFAEVSDTLAEVLDRMLLPTPNQRFQSAREAIEGTNATILIASGDSTATTPTHSPASGDSIAATSTYSSPPPPVPQPPTPQPVTPLPARTSAFPLIPVLIGAAFTGFEGALLLIALTSLLPSPGISIGLWGMIMGGLVFAEFRRVIEKFDFLIIGGITLPIVMFFLRGGIALPNVIIFAVLAGAGAIAVVALFRLVYLLLSRLLG